MSSQGKALSFVGDNLDGILALAGAFLSLVLIAYLHTNVGHIAYTAAGIISFVACVGYLVLRYRNKLSPISSILDLRASPSVLLVADIAFFLLFIYSLWSFAFRPEPYVRPLVYFVSIAAMSAILAAKILFLPSKNSRTPFTLFQIILIALSLEWSVILLFPSLIGLDPWYHQAVTLDMLDKGDARGVYGGLPVMHLAIGATSLITTLNYKMATMFSISFLQVVGDVLFIFLIGKLVFNAKIGMLAALLVGVANWHILFGYWTIPNTLGATFVVIILYLVFKFHRDRATKVIPLCVLLMAALLLTHAIAALWMAILLFSLWLCFVVYKKLFKERLATLSLLAVVLLFTAAMFGWWTFSGRIDVLGLIIEQGFDPSSLAFTQPTGLAPSEITLPEVTPPAWETLSGAPFEFLFNSLGMLLFFAVSFIGCFYMLSRRFGNPYAFFITIAGVLILSIGFFPMLTGRSVIEHRWWYMAQILLSIPLAVALCLFFRQFKKKLLQAGMMAISVFLLTFLMIMGLMSNMDNRTFSPNQLVRYASTTSELQASNTISASYEGTISYLEGILLLTKDFSQFSDQMLLVREEVVRHPIGWGGGNIYRLNYDPRQALTEQGFSKVYDSRSVSGFIR